MNFRITHGFDERHRWRAAEIYAGAFERYFATSPLAQRNLVEIFAEAISPEMSFSAIDRRDQLVGLVGMQHGGRHFIDIDLQRLRARFGPWRGLLILAQLSYMLRLNRRGQLLLDGIATDPRARGKGIGSALLEAVSDYARRGVFEQIRLDVVDTNPKARRLYERLGFRAARTVKVPKLLSRKVGFTSSTTMIKPSGGRLG